MHIPYMSLNQIFRRKCNTTYLTLIHNPLLFIPPMFNANVFRQQNLAVKPLIAVETNELIAAMFTPHVFV